MLDPKLLAKLSEAFMKVGQKPKPKRRRTHRGRRKKKPITEQGRLSSAHNELKRFLNLKSEPNSSLRKLAAGLIVTPIGEDRWLITGGECQHTVILEDSTLQCIDHTPAHQPKKEGFACSHEAAVRRYLVRQLSKAQ